MMGGSSGHRGEYRECGDSGKEHRQKRVFYTVLLVVTLCSLVLVLSACAVLVCFRIRHGSLGLGQVFSPSCPSNQEWSECGYACNLTCVEEFRVCATVCREGCECPDRAPLWHLDQCVSQDQCPNTDNVTIGLNGNHNKNKPTEVDTDTLLLQEGDSEEVKLSEFMQSLWSDSTSTLNSSCFVYRLQGRTNITMAVDSAENRLFGVTNCGVFESSDIYSSFIELLNHFNLNVKEAETMTSEKKRAINTFLDAVLSGTVMTQTESFLKMQGLISEQSFRELLYDIWFDPYPRSSRYNTSDSSGFEHVFVGEVKGRKILGLHNWIQFHLLESYQNLNYYGHIDEVFLPASQKLAVLSAQFVWGERRKRKGSFLVGTSPDLDLSVYTVCFLLHPDRACRFQLESTELAIQTYDVKHVAGWQISTAYPVI